jgi:hypothetical protein
MIPKSGQRFPACAKPCQFSDRLDATAGEGRSEKIMFQEKGLDHDLTRLNRIVV